VRLPFLPDEYPITLQLDRTASVLRNWRDDDEGNLMLSDEELDYLSTMLTRAANTITGAEPA
jgi:hypothetical protein